MLRVCELKLSDTTYSSTPKTNSSLFNCTPFFFFFTRPHLLTTMESPPLASLSLTHVNYNPKDPISWISAHLALVPQALVISYVSLIWATREIEVLLMFTGQMGCEALNYILKKYLKEPRPTRMFSDMIVTTRTDSSQNCLARVMECRPHMHNMRLSSPSICLSSCSSDTIQSTIPMPPAHTFRPLTGSDWASRHSH